MKGSAEDVDVWAYRDIGAVCLALVIVLEGVDGSAFGAHAGVDPLDVDDG